MTVEDRRRISGKELANSIRSDACGAVSSRPLKFASMTIDGEVDISSADVVRPLEFDDCHFDDIIRIAFGKCRAISFSGCMLSGVDATGTDFVHDVTFEGSQSSQPIDLTGSRIGGRLAAMRSTFSGDGDNAFGGDGIVVGGDVILEPDVEVRGTLALRRAVVAGKVAGKELVVCAVGSVAIDGESGEFRGGIEMANLVAAGQVILCSARISGSLILNCAHVAGTTPPDPTSGYSRDECAIYADRLEVSGDVFLDGSPSVGMDARADGEAHETFEAQGEVRLLGAVIGGDLTCCGGRFVSSADDSDAICITNGTIGKNFYFDSGVEARGRLNCLGLSVGGVAYVEGASLSGCSGKAIATFTQASFGGEFRFGNCRGAGDIDLSMAKFASIRLSASETKESSSRMFVDLRHSRCTLLKDEPAFWEALAGYDLRGFRYDAFLVNPSWSMHNCLTWLARASGRDRLSLQPYEHFASIQRALGFADDAKDVLIAMERRRPETWNRPASWSTKFTFALRMAWHRLNDFVSRFGHRPTRALAMLLVTWVVGSLVVFSGVHWDAFVATKRAAFVQAPNSVAGGAGKPPSALGPPTTYPHLVPLMYSAHVMVPFIDLQQKDYWMPNHGTATGFAVQCYLWLHTCLGWLFGTFAVAAVTGVIKRD